MCKNIKIPVVIVVTIALMIGSFCFSTTVFAGEIYDFPNFTEEDAMDFIEVHGIEIPEKLLRSDKVALFTLSTILQAYYEPSVAFCYNYDETQRCAEDIRAAVISHMRSYNIPVMAAAPMYTLQYNKVMDINGN